MRVLSSILFAAAIMALTGCGGNSTEKKGGTKFNPQAKESTMSDDEREEAIAAKRAELSERDAALIFGNGIKLAVMSPAADGNIDEATSKVIAQRMLDMVTANGIGGIGGDPALVFACGIAGCSTTLTATVPQKTQVSYDLQYYVANLRTGTVFGSLTQKLVGVGKDETQARQNAAKELKNGNDIQQMLKNATEKLVAYYNDNAASIKAEIESLMAQNNYEDAYSLMRGVPEQATQLFAYVEKAMPEVCRKMTLRDAAANLARLQDAINANNSEYSPEVGIILALIPDGCPQYAKAESLYNDYVKRMRAKAADKEVYDRKVADDMREKDFAYAMQKLEYDERAAKRAASEKKWDRAFGIIDNGISCIRDVGVTFGRNSSWTSFLNMSNFRDVPSQQDYDRRKAEEAENN